MSRKVLQFIERQEQFGKIIQLNYFLVSFGMFYGILLTHKLPIFLIVGSILCALTALLQRLVDRLTPREFDFAELALWIFDIAFFQTAFVLTHVTGLLFYMLIVAVATLYVRNRFALAFLLISLSHELWLKLRYDNKFFMLYSFSLVIFYLFFWFVAQHYQQKSEHLIQAQTDLIKMEKDRSTQETISELAQDLSDPLTLVVVNVDLLNRKLTKSGNIAEIQAQMDALKQNTERMRAIMVKVRSLGNKGTKLAPTIQTLL